VTTARFTIVLLIESRQSATVIRARLVHRTDTAQTERSWQFIDMPEPESAALLEYALDLD
jgi:hypothetical protein